mmetsp:Transcript_15835/g.55096  ORF Transcript_15835/g.55096 Transcript_15835/m.55096 type:complete len:233 (-) Transcript_15835:301-999(-)
MRSLSRPAAAKRASDAPPSRTTAGCTLFGSSASSMLMARFNRRAVRLGESSPVPAPLAATPRRSAPPLAMAKPPPPSRVSAAVVAARTTAEVAACTATPCHASDGQTTPRRTQHSQATPSASIGACRCSGGSDDAASDSRAAASASAASSASRSAARRAERCSCSAFVKSRTTAAAMSGTATCAPAPPSPPASAGLDGDDSKPPSKSTASSLSTTAFDAPSSPPPPEAREAA